MRSLVFIPIALFIALCAGAESRSQPTVAKPSDAWTQARFALVIGNAAYRDAPLINPTNDARDLGATLSSVGFEVDVRFNLSQVEMKRAIRDFGDRLKLNGGIGLFYFAGHGVQYRGRNYLVPVGADIQREYEIADQSVDANLVLDAFEFAGNRLNVMILDACRNNPFANKFRSLGGGLARMEAPSGVLVAFATKPDSVAIDGNDGNGLYTKHLVAEINTPGLSLEQIFKKVREQVEKDSHGLQSPREESSLKGEDFYFVRRTDALNLAGDREVEMLALAAEGGNAAAQKDLGLLYGSGTRGVAIDRAEAVKWFRKAAEQGNADGQYQLAWAYYTGAGVEKDDSEAIRWGLKAAEQGHVLAAYYAGNIYFEGKLVKTDFVQAAKWYRVAAEKDNADAQMSLGLLYITGKGVDQDPKQGAVWIKKASDGGNVYAKSTLAGLYLQGLGVPQAYDQAFDLASQTAAMGNGVGFLVLGRIYGEGLGRPKDLAKAKENFEAALAHGTGEARPFLDWVKNEALLSSPVITRSAEGKRDAESVDLIRLRASAEAGQADAQNTLGFMYGTEKGGLKRDPDKAFFWYMKAAKSGHTVAQENVAYSYMNGLGVARDPAEAAKWYRRAADQGLATSQRSLADLYYSGNGVEENKTEAVMWYRKAAAAGNEGAQVALGSMYAAGDGGLPRDESEAERWVASHAKHGNSDAQFILGLVLVGNSLKSNPRQAEGVEWIRKSAAQNNPSASAQMGEFYEYGWAGIKADPFQALTYYRRAADLQNPQGESGLGRLYFSGMGGAVKDEIEAFKWFRLAADKGDLYAMNQVGLAYFRGAGGIQVDQAVAIHWFRKAAMGGWIDAEVNLAYAYEKGAGTDKNLEEAAKWYNTAAQAGNEQAKLALVRLKEK